MRRDISSPRVWVLWAVFVFITFQFLLCSGPTGSTVTRHNWHVPSQLPDLYEASIAELQYGLENGHFTSVDLVKVPPSNLPPV
ncbi:hypothetical protein BJY52DRAFT_1304638, partial [Lactarius psammicola]